jgi:hypothetical protein
MFLLIRLLFLFHLIEFFLAKEIFSEKTNSPSNKLAFITIFFFSNRKFFEILINDK